MSQSLLSLILIITTPPLVAQSAAGISQRQGIYFLSATPSGNSMERFGADLYKFDSNGALTLVREIVKPDRVREERGIDFVLIDYDSRVLLIGSPNVVPDRIDLVFMDRPESASSRVLTPPDLEKAPWVPWSARVQADDVRTRGPRHRNSASLVSARLMRDTRGKFLALHYGSDRGRVQIGYPITSTGLGGPVFLQDKDLTNATASGSFGLRKLGQSDAIGVENVRDRFAIPGVGEIALPPPAEIRQNSGKANGYALSIHNDKMSVLQMNRDPETALIGVWNPRSRNWTTFPVPGGYPRLRNFDKWILGVSASEARGRVSPGSQERSARKEREKSASFAATARKRPDTDYWLKETREFYPGVLFLIDTESGKMIQFQTDQGDSEILAVQGQTVYFRINDRLFMAGIDKNTITPPTLLGQDDAVPDMHWAFFK